MPLVSRTMNKLKVSQLKRSIRALAQIRRENEILLRYARKTISIGKRLHPRGK
jgi:hypothetical protein